MTYEVRIADSFETWRLKFYLLDRNEQGLDRLLTIRGDDVYQWVDIPDGGVYVEPTFTLEEAAARALLGALLTHFQGSEDTRMLRKDYDAERARVDKLIDATIRQAEVTPLDASAR